MKYKIKCKSCGEILEAEVPIKNEIKCKCGNIAIYSDYIAYGMQNHLPMEECFEKLTESLTIKEVTKQLNNLEK